MARVLSTLLVLALLGGTAAAFALTERLKLQPSPITRVRVDKGLSPGCQCPFRAASIGFGLREEDRVTLSVVDDDGNRVRELLASGRLPAGFHSFAWDGRDDSGRIVAEGTYRPRLHLADDRRTIALRNPIEVDTTPPRIAVLGVGRRVISPDGDGRGEGMTIRYRVSERALVLLFVDGTVGVRHKARDPKGALHWYGKLEGRGLPAGRYRLDVAVEDQLGNRSEPVAATTVRVRYIELSRSVVRVRARARFRIGVLTDARRYRWRLAGRTGDARARLLRLRAPRPGRYTLFVETSGHADRATVLVRPRP